MSLEVEAFFNSVLIASNLILIEFFLAENKIRVPNTSQHFTNLPNHVRKRSFPVGQIKLPTVSCIRSLIMDFFRKWININNIGETSTSALICWWRLRAWTENLQFENCFSNYLSLDLSIHFTLEKENIRALPFLDTVVKRTHISMFFIVYRKLYSINTDIHNFLNHPHHKKINTFTLFHRAPKTYDADTLNN